MTSLALPLPSARFGATRPLAERAILALALLLMMLLAAAMLRQGLRGGGAFLPRTHTIWLVVHLAAVLPAVPLGAYLLWARKGDRLHRLLGRAWGLLMMATALSSFGLRASGHLGWIHLLALVTLIAVPRAVLLAVRGRIAEHRVAMLRVYLSLVVAGFFTFLPGRLLGAWLFG